MSNSIYAARAAKSARTAAEGARADGRTAAAKALDAAAYAAEPADASEQFARRQRAIGHKAGNAALTPDEVAIFREALIRSAE